MDNQNTLVIGGAVVGMFVIGGFFLSGPDRHDRGRPAYANEDVRYKFQQEDLKKKTNKMSARRAPTYATGNSSNAGAASERSENEEPSVFDHEPQEEPPLD